MGFHWDMGNSRQRILAFQHQVRFFERLVQIAFSAFIPAGDVGILLWEEDAHVVFQVVDVIVNQDFTLKRFVHVVDRRQGFVDHIQKRDGAFGCFFIFGSHGGNHVALIASLALGEDAFVLHVETDQNVGVLTGQNSPNAGQGFGFAGVDRDDLCAGIRREQAACVQHAGKFHVVGINSLPGDFIEGIFTIVRLTNPLVF